MSSLGNLEKKELEVLVEPVIKKKWLPKLITWNRLITSSHIRTKIALKVTPRGKDLPEKLVLRNIELGTEKLKGYQRTFSQKFKIEGLESNKSKETETFKIVIPYPGAFWLDVKVHPLPNASFKVITKQRTLEGDEGYGKPKDKPDEEVCRMPIGAVDILTVGLTLLTIGLLIVTILLLIFT